ncbi:MAG TPA: cytochrome P450, partial [Thermoanaerobaculia bacterium]|nr:cytochrome P450 [Thermoanaerobaculia bacterium]
AKALTNAATASGKTSGQLELAGYAQLAPLQLAGEYFGLPGPDPQTLGTWIRTIFTELFLNLNNDPKITAAGAQAGKDFGAYIDARIAAVRSGAAEAPGRDTVLGRLLAMQADPDTALADDRVRVNLIGLVVGMIDNTQMAVVNAIDVLLAHPDQLAGAIAAAGAADPTALLAYVLEALRFHSPAPLLVRLADQGHTLAKGTPRETAIPAGRVIFAANGSAMMDAAELDHPEQFTLGRPNYQYLHFGFGIHQCFGKYISQVQVTELVRAVLLLPGLKRAAGADGQLVYAGPFPKSFTVEFGSGSV